MAQKTATRRKTRKPPPRRRTRNPEQSRKALLDAAGTLFNTVGYQGTDSNRIARAAGYAPGTFYVHFPDKLAIFLEVYRTWVDDELEAIRSVFESAGPAASVRTQFVQAILKHHRRWRTFRATLRALSATDDTVHAARLEQRARQISTLEQQVGSFTGRQLSRSQIWYALLAFEIVCDSIADGDAKALSVPEAGLTTILEGMLGPLLEA